jgi:flagellar hook-associated protein 2
MNITSAGIGSGLDLESIITAFVTAESVPTEIRLQEKEERLNIELSGIGSFKSALSSFQSVVDKLKTADALSEQILDVSTDDVSITTNGSASNGSFSIDVQQLAQGSRVQSASIVSSTSLIGSGTLTFAAGSNTFDVAIDGADDLSAIRDKINAESANFGVTANIINSDGEAHLVYKSSITGDANNLTITTSDASLASISTNTSQDPINDVAKSAIVLVDGFTVTSDTNELKNVIEDVTIVANKVSTSATTLDISQNQAVANGLIQEFVDGYNALAENMLGLGAPKAGRLAFDPDLRSMKSQLNDILINSVSGMSGSVDSLSDIGVSIDRYGKLEISSVGIGSLDSGKQKLADAIENNLDQVGELFASPDGIVSQLTMLIDNYNDSDGTLTKRQTSLNKGLSSISDEYDDLETRLRSYEDTLRKRFSFLDSTVAGYDATAAFLESALKPVSKD